MATIPQIRDRLLEAFPERQADLLAHVFVESHDDLVRQSDFHALTGVVKDLAEAQKDLAEAQKDLAEAQKEFSDAQKELAEAQKELASAQRETEEAVQVMSESVKELSESQKRTDAAVADLAKQVGGLSNALGGSLEDFACDLVPEILEKHWGLVTASAGPEEIAAGRRHREIDVVVRGMIAGRTVTILCETKASISPNEVVRFLRIVEKVRADRPGEDIRPLFFGYKAVRRAREMIVQAGAAMVFTRGVMIPAAA